MIPLEKQVTSLESSRRLKELGVKQDSLFYITAKGNLFNEQHATKIEDYSAFTVAELGGMLPQYTESYRIATNRFSCKFCELLEDKKGDPVNGEPIIKVCDTEADARAEMLIYLIENKRIGV